jgi:hypothetical protein
MDTLNQPNGSKSKSRGPRLEESWFYKVGAGCGVITLPATYENTVDLESDVCSLDGLDWLIPF